MTLSKETLEYGMIAARDVALASIRNDDYVEDAVIYDRMIQALDDAGIDGDTQELKRWAQRWFTCVNDCQYEDISRLSPGGIYWKKYYDELIDVTGGSDEQLATIHELWVEKQAGVMEWSNEQKPAGHIGLDNFESLTDFIEKTYKIQHGYVARICFIILKQLLDDNKILSRAIQPHIAMMINMIGSAFGSPGAVQNLYGVFVATMKEACELVQDHLDLVRSYEDPTRAVAKIAQRSN